MPLLAAIWQRAGWRAAILGVRAGATPCPRSRPFSSAIFPAPLRAPPAMNDIRRTALWVVFIFSLLMLWNNWQLHKGRPGMFTPPPQAAGSAPAPAGVPTAGSASVSPPPAAVPGLPAAPVAAVPEATGGELITVDTDVLRLTFDTAGGSLVRSEFLKHIGADGQPFVLLDNSPARTYQAQTGLLGGSGAFPTHKTLMRFSGPRHLADGAGEMQLRFEAPDAGGLRLVKTYTLRRGEYAIGVRHDITNTSGQSLTPQMYMQLVRDGGKPGGETGFYSTFTGPAFYSPEQKFQKAGFDDIDKGKADFVRDTSGGWVAMVQHYFASAWLPAEGTPRSNFVRKDGTLYSAGSILGATSIAPGATHSIDARFFAGPQEETMLEAIAPGLELVKDYGWFTIFAKPLYKLLRLLHRILGNWGWSIIALVLLLKIAFYWLNAKAYASMAKMKAINPRITQLRERYADNPAQMQQEMMRIYREEKVNPMGGCLPMIVQIPVFIALYWVLLSSVEMRGAPWMGWIHDLSARDPYFILPILMTVTTLLQTALNPQPPDPTQAKMMWFMPLMFSVMFFFFPSGLVLYWLTNNVLTIIQQWIINRHMGVPPQFNLPKF